MYIDLIHVLYVYSRVMGGGGVITKYSRGGGRYMYVYVVSLTSIKHIQCSDNRGACRYVVQGNIYARA